MNRATAGATRAQRIFMYEQELGFNNRAVVGGLEVFTSRVEPGVAWADEVRRILSGYASRDVRARQGMIERALAVVARVSIENVPTREPARPRPPAPSASVGSNGSGQAATLPVRSPTVSGPRNRPVVTEGSEATTPLSPHSPVSALPGVGAKTVEGFSRLGINSVFDLLYHLPRRHLDRRSLTPLANLQPGQVATVMVTVVSVNVKSPARRGLTITEAQVRDESGYAQAVWFNQQYMLRRLGNSGQVLLSGRVEQQAGGAMQFTSPELETDLEDSLHAGRLVPFYAKTEGITDKQLRTVIRRALDLTGPALRDALPVEVRAQENLLPFVTALEVAHFPDTWERHAEAVRRLAFDEFLIIQLGVLRRRHEWQTSNPGLAFVIPEATIGEFVSRLPYTLTGAQSRVTAEIYGDLVRPVAMSRLLQGEVGSGKTAVAAAACLAAVRAGYQVAFMAPTDILAQQHERSVSATLGPLGVRVARMTGSQKRKEKREIWSACAAGEIDVMVGTHALLDEDEGFHRLGLAIVDEQHRFGVRQRSALLAKGANPHLLVMTATPIPRTLALSVYGDLDLSIINELPPGRLPIKTAMIPPEKRMEAYGFLRRQVRLGRQGFIIFPLVEESERIEARAATAEHERLQRQFPDLRLALVHGRLSPREKDEVMSRFRDGHADVLVATAVVEVGIDVPNASTILIEGADRFGLAQLHQFRGRVGRGPHASYCLLLTETDAEPTLARLRALERTSDGFVLAEEDLRMRGPGEFFGTRQSGVPDLKVARLSDVHVLEAARRQAELILGRDQTLSLPDHARLRSQVEAYWNRSVAAG